MLFGHSGPSLVLLFIIYINDLVRIVRDSFCNMYADDTVIVSSDSDINTAILKSRDMFVCINEWCAMNTIVVNKKKTKHMLIGCKSKVDAVDDPGLD